MKKIFLGIPLLFVALAVACAQQSGGDRQAGSGGYTPWAGAQPSSNGAVGRSGEDPPYGSQDEYGGGVGGQSSIQSTHGFDRGIQTKRWGPAGRPSGPVSGFSDMGHGLGTQTSPPAVGGSISESGVGQ
ncbi:MAG: hypothetical protein PHS17_08675 [Desulfobacterales bacterium]|nr:hypothetical protein [Desulfobacterales bacterium]